MKKYLATAAIVLSVSTALAAESTPERDILGFHPGMSYTQAMSVTAGLCKGNRDMSSPEIPSFGFSSIFVKCSAGMRQEFFTTNPNLKQDREEALVLVFAADLPEQPLSSVVYSFVSGLQIKTSSRQLSTNSEFRPCAKRWTTTRCVSATACN
jgi:hypothetical protein